MKMHLNCELQAVCDCGSVSPMDECDGIRWNVIAGDPYSGCGRAAAASRCVDVDSDPTCL